MYLYKYSTVDETSTIAQLMHDRNNNIRETKRKSILQLLASICCLPSPGQLLCLTAWYDWVVAPHSVITEVHTISSSLTGQCVRFKHWSHQFKSLTKSGQDTHTNKKHRCKHYKVMRNYNVIISSALLAVAIVASQNAFLVNAADADECLPVETVKGLNLEEFISAPWYGKSSEGRSKVVFVWDLLYDCILFSLHSLILSISNPLNCLMNRYDSFYSICSAYISFTLLKSKLVMFLYFILSLFWILVALSPFWIGWVKASTIFLSIFNA